MSDRLLEMELERQPMNLNSLLRSSDIDPQQVLVLRHSPQEKALRKVLPWLAAERPQTFNAYQQTQGRTVEQAMSRAAFVASFIGRRAGTAHFVGLYSVGSSRSMNRDEFWEVPEHRELKAFGLRGMAEDDPRQSLLWFDLNLTDFYAQWKGKLIVGWPPPERSWWRRSHKNDMPVVAVLEESAFEADMPSWDEIALMWEELRVIPARWQARLSEWRAIYYIVDISDGKAYVGSAYGNSNLLGRWQNYGSRGHGGNVLLQRRQPEHLRFSILQRVSPDMDAGDVIRLEASWKERLRTRHPFGLNDN